MTGIEETSLRALAKLEQVLPAAAAQPGQHAPDVHACTSARPGGADGRPGDADRARRGLPRPPRGCASTTPTGAASATPAAGRAVPPRQRRPALVPGRVGHRPGGLADVPGRPDAAAACRSGRGSRRAPLSDADVEALVSRGVPPAARRFQARVTRPRPGGGHRRADRAVGRDGDGRRRPLRASSTPAPTRSSILAVYLGMLGADFTVIDAPELVEPPPAAGRSLRAGRRALTFHRAVRRGGSPRGDAGRRSPAGRSSARCRSRRPGTRTARPARPAGPRRVGGRRGRIRR